MALFTCYSHTTIHIRRLHDSDDTQISSLASLWCKEKRKKTGDEWMVVLLLIAGASVAIDKLFASSFFFPTDRPSRDGAMETKHFVLGWPWEILKLRKTSFDLMLWNHTVTKIINDHALTHLCIIFLPRIRCYISQKRGHDMEKVITGRVPGGREFFRIFAQSRSKRFYFRFGQTSTSESSSFLVLIFK